MLIAGQGKIYAQVKNISGIITEANEEPIIGANVIVKGTTNGTITNFDGEFSLEVPADAVLQISYIGYLPQEIPVGNQTIFTIILKEDTQALEEVVVVGYGSVRKSDLTSSVTSVKAEDMGVSATPNIGTALQGIAPGVEVATNSASPGGQVDIRIRGVGTLNDNSPLYIVDGMPVNSLEFVNTNDIERMEILKDATSAAIYGSRGSNGVVLITTKSGKDGDGKYTISFDGSFGVQTLGNKLKMADANEYARIFNQARENSGVDGRIDLNSLSGKGTDWVKEITRLAPSHNYNLNITGGNKVSSISAGIGYYGQKGVVESSDYEKYSARLNANIQPNKIVSFHFNLIAGHTNRDLIAGEKDQYGGVLFNALLIDPITPVMKPESEWVENPLSNYHRSLYTEIGNPAATIARTNDNIKQYSGVVNMGMKLDFTDYLFFKTTFGVEYKDSKQKTFSPEFYINPNEKNDDNKVENENYYWLNYAWENTLNFQKTFNSIHRLSVMAGYTMEYNKSESVYATKTNTPGNANAYQYLQLATLNADADGTFSKNTMISYLGRVNYSYLDKYIVTANFREDDSSRFAKGNKWGFFPSVSAAWVISNENFFPDTKAVSFLKLRIGYGQIGNQNISNYAYIDQIRNIYRYSFGGTLSSGLATYKPGNASVKWETTEDFSMGIDGTSLNGALTWTIDLYSRKTRDMLLDNPVPGYTGLFEDPVELSAGIWENVGSIRNQGIEVSLEYRGQVNKLKYRVRGNVSFVKNKVLELGAVEFISAGNIREVGDITRTQVGSSIARFWGYKTDGIFQSWEEINAYQKEGSLIQPNAKPGDLKFIDKNGDGQITDDDKDWIGSPLPTATGGININLEYNGFDFRAYFYGVIGNKVMDANSVFYSSGKDLYNSLAGTYENTWSETNTSAKNPRLAAKDENANYQRFSDHLLQNGSYLRLKDLQIGYSFKRNVTDKLGMTKLRLYFATQNLFTITSYKGMEPETSSASVSTLGIDYGNYPSARAYLFGLNVAF